MPIYLAVDSSLSMRSLPEEGSDKTCWQVACELTAKLVERLTAFGISDLIKLVKTLRINTALLSIDFPENSPLTSTCNYLPPVSKITTVAVWWRSALVYQAFAVFATVPGGKLNEKWMHLCDDLGEIIFCSKHEKFFLNIEAIRLINKRTSPCTTNMEEDLLRPLVQSKESLRNFELFHRSDTNIASESSFNKTAFHLFSINRFLEIAQKYQRNCLI